MSELVLAARNVWRNRRRSTLTIGIVVFGFAAIALAGGFMAQSFEGLKQVTIFSGIGHLQLARQEQFIETGENTLEYGLPYDSNLLDLIKNRMDVDAVLPRIEFMGLISSGMQSVPFLGIGFLPSEEARIMQLPSMLVSGNWLNDDDEQTVILGTGLARTLDVEPGQVVTMIATTRDGVLNALDVTVTGLIQLPLKEINDRYLATSLSTASTLLGASGMVSKLIIMLKPEQDLQVEKDTLLRSVKIEGMQLAVKTWLDLGTFYHQVKLLYTAIFGFMGIVLIIVILLACANTMTMATMERIREIGTLRAIGSQPGHIQRVFVYEGIVIALLGSLGGSLLALFVRAVLNASNFVLPAPPGGTHGFPIHVAFYGLSYLIGFGIMLVTLALAAYFPARRASKIPIVQALTHI